MDADLDFEALYRTVLPSVVSLYRAADDPRRGGAGSGFVYDPSHLVTNQHVVGDERTMDVRLSDDTWRRGTVVGADAYTDLAVVEVADLPPTARPLPVADTNPSPGRRVAALGNPLGLEGSITAGIVSGANRSMPTGRGFAIPDVVQTDAPINPGNSGGPLVARVAESADEPAYEAVGVNRARQGDNIGFAISPAVVERVVPTLIEDGRVSHPYLRVSTIDVSPTVAEANGLPSPGGVLVADAHASVRGTLRPCRSTRTVRGREIPTGGDVIEGIDGRPVGSHEALMRYLITEAEPGEPVTLSLRRDGQRIEQAVTLAARPDPSGRIPIV